MRLLLVEDEERLVEALSYLLRKNGYTVDTALDGNLGMEMASTGIYDVIILDRMLPGLDGIQILVEIRRQQFDTPVLLLTAKDAPKDRVEGLDAGADDYLVKPFATDELLARLRALGRRKSKPFADIRVSAGDLILDPLRCEVNKGEEVISLSAKESLLLQLLMGNPGQVVSKERIFEKVWGYYSEAEFANVELYIHYLRKKLGNEYIKTVRGIGYYFVGGQ